MKVLIKILLMLLFVAMTFPIIIVSQLVQMVCILFDSVMHHFSNKGTSNYAEYCTDKMTDRWFGFIEKCLDKVSEW